ncbi:MAG: glycosyltransferase [Polyangiaceae bacterium]|nr:glycosyltransferase [Polyangiaceae bacterium]MBK8939489.1 glycosyltransferase [Polyangiaceae bacterium]
MTPIPLTIAAKNEEATLGPCLDAIRAAAHYAERREGLRFDVLVVADDCSDGTATVARGRGVRVLESTGGKVEAQRAGARGREGPFHVFVDADVLIAEATLHALARALFERPQVFVATPPRLPLPPRSRSRLARALCIYNQRRGFSSQRTWFNGRCFAIRSWDIPTRAELRPRARRLPPDPFYDYEDGVRADDIYLSRRVVAERGPSALAETEEGVVLFRAAETLEGMFRTYRRMRMELERVSALFPELEAAHARYGTRRMDLLPTATPSERLALAHFDAALTLCRARYRLERAHARHLALEPLVPWPAIAETKCSLAMPTRG